MAKVKQSFGTITFVPQSKFSKRVFFEYPPGETSFQLGYLGSDKSTIGGTLRLRYNDDKPLLAKKITLSFVGKEFVSFAGTLKEGQEVVEEDNNDNERESCSEEGCEQEEQEETPETTVSTYTTKHQFFGNSIIIWRSQNKGHYENIKFLDLPFKFDLPDNLPPSVTMDGGNGRIYYMLKAVISRKIDLNSRKIKKVIKYVVPIVRYTITPQPRAISWIRKEEGPAKNYVLNHDVSVTRSIFSPGESVIVPVKLSFHEPKIYLRKIFVGLKEYHELRTDEYVTLTKKYLAQESIEANTIQGPDNEYSVKVKLNVPSEREIVYSVDTTYLTVYHKLKVKVSLGKAPDLNLSNIVKIEKIVSREEVFPPPPPPKIEISETPEIAEALPSKVVAAHEPVVVKSKQQQQPFRRISPFFPLFNKIQNGRNNGKKYPLKLQPIQIHIADSKNPNLVYNSRSLVIPRSKKEHKKDRAQQAF